jgi:hypothetical protein
MSIPPEFEKAHQPRDVDLNAAHRGVWLVKVKVKYHFDVVNTQKITKIIYNYRNSL